MAHLTLNCPKCRRQLIHVPLDGLTLHYRCAEHGLVILKPLVETATDERSLFDTCATELHAVTAA
jgi:hypothetical protein